MSKNFPRIEQAITVEFHLDANAARAWKAACPRMPFKHLRPATLSLSRSSTRRSRQQEREDGNGQFRVSVMVDDGNIGWVIDSPDLSVQRNLFRRLAAMQVIPESEMCSWCSAF